MATCQVCGKCLVRDQKRFCSHKCVWVVIKDKVRAAALTPEAIKKRADRKRGSGKWNGYIKRNRRHEHRSVAEQILGRPLRRGEIVHHKDGLKRNNAPENLEVIPSQAEHARRHRTGMRLPPKLVCKFGHSLQGKNVVITSAGRRRCLICQRRYDNEWKKAKRRARKNEDCRTSS